MASYSETKLRDNNYGFGHLPQNRGSWKNYLSYCFMVAFLFYFYWEIRNVKPDNYSCNNITSREDSRYMIHTFDYVYSFFMAFWGVLAAKFIQIVCVFAEEWKHVKIRYNGSTLEMIKSCFQVFLSSSSLVGIPLLLCFTLVMMTVIDKELFDYQHIKYWQGLITSLGGSFIANHLFGLQKLSVVELSEIHESSNINVAQGLAWSYYTGYLKIILKDLERVIKESPKWKSVYEEENLECKFFAIVPLNCKVIPKIGTDITEGILTQEIKLPPQFRKDDDTRSYINSVYKITNEKGDSCFGICDYVTTIDTLHKMSDSTEINKSTQEKQCRLFVKTLTELIYDDGFQGKCEIVTLKGEGRPLLRNVLYDRVSKSLEKMKNPVQTETTL